MDSYKKVNSKVATTALLLGVGAISYFAGYKTAQPDAMHTKPKVANMMNKMPDEDDLVNMDTYYAVGHETNIAWE